MSAPGTVETYMSANPISFTPQMAIHEAIKILLEHGISGAPVLDGKGDLVGMLTKKDCLRTAFDASYHQDRGGWVADYMSPNVESLDVDTDIVEAAQHFVDGHFHRYPVTRDGRLAGIVSRHDILRAILDLW